MFEDNPNDGNGSHKKTKHVDSSCENQCNIETLEGE